MSKVSLELIQRLRQLSGLGMLDCKKALEEANGDLDQAIELLRKKGAAVAAKRSDRETAEGIVHAYIHPGSQIGVMVEVDCETDFVARTDDIRQFAQDLCLHITALNPMYLKPEDVDPAFLDREKKLMHEQLADSGKPEKIISQIVEGKVNKLYSDVCLMNQTWVKNDQLTVEDARKELVGKVGENISVRRFARFQVGA